MEISEDGGEDTEVDTKANLMYAQSPGSMRILIMMNYTSRKLYHQKTKEIQIPLFIPYIISWR